jgi:hypothetical protein
MTEAPPGYRPNDDPETTLRKIEAQVAQNYDRRLDMNVTNALIAVLELIENARPGEPCIINCTAIPDKTGVKQQTLENAMTCKLTQFSFTPYSEDSFCFVVTRKKK